MQRPKFENGAIYHVSNEGINDRPLFRCDDDRLRFLHAMAELNQLSNAENSGYSFRRPHLRRGPCVPIVEIVAFSLASAEYHLLLRQIHEGGIPSFMGKVGTAYTLYFNRRYDREGPLFDGRYRSEQLSREADLREFVHFVHAIEHEEKSREELLAYRWSSLMDYLGERNFPLLTRRAFILDFFGGREAYEEDFFTWLEG